MIDHYIPLAIATVTTVGSIVVAWINRHKPDGKPRQKPRRKRKPSKPSP